ncbi:exodeoxyribonuclease VII small subunit [Petroclostridium xylanilyticum]|jgi:exodeoxyribonuclease VII small subunit|uniref:exodeoxyribonuclease VII small subunit n=1 Tax=Petroclostridium xylanilyticum TaxID=1792311 RepID=UPI000B98B74F|nr:exodeoxyribonuclease VII small subunit [Petroclostridium xylanilyticum]
MNFEESLKKLEDIVRQLEEGELTLEQSLDFFQQGIMLSKICSKMLDEAEQKVNILIRDKNGGISEQPFQSNQEEAADGF